MCIGGAWRGARSRLVLRRNQPYSHLIARHTQLPEAFRPKARVAVYAELLELRKRAPHNLGSQGSGAVVAEVVVVAIVAVVAGNLTQ